MGSSVMPITKRNSSTSVEDKIARLSLEQPKSECPIANLEQKPDFTVETKCPFHHTVHKGTPSDEDKDTAALAAEKYGSHVARTADFLKDIGGGDRIRQMTTRFYAHAFEDQTLSKFMFERDCAAAHGQRLGDWIIEKMGEYNNSFLL